MVRVLRVLARHSEEEFATTTYRSSPSIANDAHFRAWDMVASIGQLRMSRTAHLEAAFPFAHWALLGLLALCLPLSLVLLLLWSPYSETVSHAAGASRLQPMRARHAGVCWWRPCPYRHPPPGANAD